MTQGPCCLSLYSSPFTYMITLDGLTIISHQLLQKRKKQKYKLKTKKKQQKLYRMFQCECMELFECMCIEYVNGEW